ncbi:phosphopantothenoylcysteine synthetase [Arctopsyche grandis]|uniref:phosphopantothenoylcysteine synthetase n=1 Tax=Arctopsyche grandis TaxID=121162 RepID=UPI00406D7022
MSTAEWEHFYASHAPPAELPEHRQQITDFCKHHQPNKIVLLTSGGTTVPLEHNTVRFVDNFSAGTRGAASAEYFLDNGYAVIFMYRQKSLEPFSRHFGGQKFLDMLEIQEKGSDVAINVKSNYINTIKPILSKYKSAHRENKILYVSFTTVSDYLWLLRVACECLTSSGANCLLYLAAAVSDFYVPSNEMPTHKMQSGEGAPVIQLQLVPKMLTPLVNNWVPRAYVVSFKLETDENLLISKSRHALNKYKHKLVIANVLQTRRHQVTFVTPETSFVINLNTEEMDSGIEIEESIVKNVISCHKEHIKQLDSH